ncbi:MAG: glycine--tRNA ligase, partial [Candidatus Nealsonbacteria bacterium CG23_combo_of_CG06-09_8_20_14_all_39_25]
RRGDEVGTIVSIACDFQTLEDNTVTLRDRDSMKQIRVEIPKLKDIIQKILEGEDFFKLGEIIK